MSRLCANPLWPCAMTGAASALAGIKDLGVIIHGSSGCYIYADMAIPDTLYSTFIVEDEVIFGACERLCEVVESVSQLCSKTAIINTCVPSATGEDIKGALSDYDCIIVDAGGFKGDFDFGWKSAAEALQPKCSEEREGVNIEGICSLDPFSRGSLYEAKRLLDLSGISAASVFFNDSYESIMHPSFNSITINPDYITGAVENTFSILGLSNTEEAFLQLSKEFPDADTQPVLNLTEEAREILTKAGDKYLRRNDPPRAAVFSTKSYAEFACGMLKEYLDCDIVVLGGRNGDVETDFGIKGRQETDMRRIKSEIAKEKPDLIIGSSFEYAGFPQIPFVSLTFPVRHQKMLWHRPLAGVEGSLYFLDSVINALEKNY